MGEMNIAMLLCQNMNRSSFSAGYKMSKISFLLSSASPIFQNVYNELVFICKKKKNTGKMKSTELYTGNDLAAVVPDVASVLMEIGRNVAFPWMSHHSSGESELQLEV